MLTRSEKSRESKRSSRANRSAATSDVPNAPEIVESVDANAIARLLRSIGHAGLDQVSFDAAVQAIATAAADVADSTHAVLVPLDVNAIGGRVLSNTVGSSELSGVHMSALDLVFGDRIRSASRSGGMVIGPDFLPGLGACHALAVPVSCDGEPAIALVLLREHKDGYTESDLEIAMSAADQVALAIQFARAEDDVRHRTLERQLVSRITQTVVGMQDLDLVLIEVASAVRSISDWDACVVGVYSRDIDCLTVQASVKRSDDVSGIPGTGERMRLNDWQNLRFALDNCSPYQLGLDHSETLSEYERTHLGEQGIAAVLAVPFVVLGEAVGVVLLFSRTHRSLEARDLRTVEEIGANAALAIQHSQYADQAKQQADEQTALLRVSQAVISGKDLHVILSEIARVSLGFDGVEACRVLLWHKEQDQFEIGAMQSVRDWQMLYQVSDRYQVTDWPSCRAVMQSAAPRGFHVSDQELSARERANHVADGIQSFHSFPIMLGDSATGVLSLMSRRRRRLPAHAIKIGQELASQAAHAIDRANLFGQLRRRAETDGLTGLLNHRAAFETLDRELAAARKAFGITLDHHHRPGRLQVLQ